MELKYGDKTIDFAIDSASPAQVLIPQTGNIAREPAALLQKAMMEPTAGRPLPERIREQKPERVAVIVEDKTRKNPEYPVFLDQLISCVLEARQCEIDLVVAYGSHPRHSLEENERLYGKKNLDRVNIINHSAKDTANLIKAGTLSSGNVLYLNKRVATADFVISFGDITPHAFAGFSGGRKAILPGVSGFETIERNHTLVSDSGSVLGKLKDNPLHQEMMEAASMAGLDFIINSVRNAAGEIVSLVSGEHEPAFYEGARICREINQVRIPAPADVVFVSCGGFPKDKCLYHAQRAVIAATGAVKKGGTVVVFGQFPEGVGEATYQTWLQKPLPEILSLPPEEIHLGIHSAYLMARNLSHAEVILYTEMDESLVRALHYRKLDLDGIRNYLTDKHGPNYQAYIIPNGSQILILTGEE